MRPAFVRPTRFSLFGGLLAALLAAPARAEPPRSVALFDGKSLAGWRVLEEGDFKRHGAVKVENGAIVLAAGDPQTGVAYTGEFPRVNYEVTLEAKRTAGDDFFCGLTFPVDKEYCTLILGGWGGGVVGLSNVNGLSADENETSDGREFENNRWYAIRLRVTAAKIEVWLDGKTLVDLERRDRKFSIWWEQEPARPFGVAAWRAGAALRNARLTRLEAK